MKALLKKNALFLFAVLAIGLAIGAPTTVAEDEGDNVPVGVATFVPQGTCDPVNTSSGQVCSGIAPSVSQNYVWFIGYACTEEDFDGTCFDATHESASEPCPTNGENDLWGPFPAALYHNVHSIAASASCWNKIYEGAPPLWTHLLTCKSSCNVANDVADRAESWVFS